MVSSKSYELFIRFRKCVFDFVNNGGSKAETSRRFGISQGIISEWLDAEDPLTSKKPGPQGHWCLDYQALKQHVADFPDATQQGRAAHFGVFEHSIWYALKNLNITRKKKRTYQDHLLSKITMTS